jgi:mono/diheme cytochrome c family protein
MKKVFKAILWIVLGIILIIVALTGYVQLASKKTFNAPYPDIQASTDPAVIERGKYLAYGPSHCAVCHVSSDKVMAVENGLEMPLMGGWEEEFPGFGVFRGPNLTPDPETGIGNLTDKEIARAIRYGVKHDGSMLAPFMEFQGMSDEDLTAVVSFLRSQEPVSHKVEPSELSLVAKALVAFGLLKPKGPIVNPPVSVIPDTTAAYGGYLANHLGNCRGCHITMDDKGNQTSPDFSGGGVFPPGAFSKGYAFISPNLTPHKSTGVMAEWTEKAFIDRFRGGRVHEGSPMPWGLYSHMHEGDLKALYRYLASLEPVENSVPKTVFSPGEKFPPEF